MAETPTPSSPAVRPPAAATRGPDAVSLRAQMEGLGQLVEAGKAANTRAAYRAGWKHFASWCAEEGWDPTPPVPPAVLGLYLQAHRHLAPATMRLRLAAIRHEHRKHGVQYPADHEDLRASWNGFRRLSTHAKSRRPGRDQRGGQVEPISIELLRAMVATCDSTTLRGLRDRALLLVGFFGAFRRSELARLHFDQLRFTPDGLVVRMGKTKNDPYGERDGKKALQSFAGAMGDLCPVRALKAWLTAAHIEAGFVFCGVGRRGKVFDKGEHLGVQPEGLGPASDGARQGLHPKAIARLVKRAARASVQGSGVEGERRRRELEAQLSGHSLRVGFINEAGRRGATVQDIVRVTLQTPATALGYFREAELFKDHPASVFER